MKSGIDVQYIVRYTWFIGGDVMLAVNYSQFRENMKENMDLVTEDFETLIVTRKTKNVVVISEDAYNNLLENAYIMGEKANFDWLMESKRQLTAGKSTKHELIEVDDE
jgi:antitoxin YefM